MEQETDILHLLETHQIILFLVCSAVILALMFFVGIQTGKWRERRKKRSDTKPNDG